MTVHVADESKIEAVKYQVAQYLRKRHDIAS